MSDTARPRRTYDATSRRVRASATRVRIVEAATRAFLDRGYAGATIPQIAADDEAALVEATAASFVNHEAPTGTPSGPGGAIYYMHLLNRAFSDQRWTIEHVMSDGDVVAIRCTHSGRHTGDYFGMQATGRTFRYRQMHMIRFADGKSVEHWAVRDDASLMRQLSGAGSAPGD